MYSKNVNKLISIIFGSAFRLGAASPSLCSLARLRSEVTTVGFDFQRADRACFCCPFGSCCYNAAYRPRLALKALVNLVQPRTFQSCHTAKSSLEKAHFVLPGLVSVTLLRTK